MKYHSIFCLTKMGENLLIEDDTNELLFGSEQRQTGQLVVEDMNDTTKKCNKCHWSLCFVITLILACIPFAFITGLEMGRNSGTSQELVNIDHVTPEPLFRATSTTLKMEFDRYYISNDSKFKIVVGYGRNCNDNIESNVCTWEIVSELTLTNLNRQIDLDDLGPLDLDTDLIMIYFDQIGNNRVDWLTIFQLEFTAGVYQMRNQTFNLRGPGLLKLYDHDINLSRWAPTAGSEFYVFTHNFLTGEQWSMRNPLLK